MPLQDVSQDPSMLGWLRQSGHGHLLEGGQRTGNTAPIMRETPPARPVEIPRPDPPPSFPRVDTFQSQSYGQQPNSANFVSSPTQFLAPNSNQYQFDAEVDNLRRDPNTRVIQRPNNDDLVYKQRVFVRYLQPPTPPVGGTIIVRETQAPQPPPDPPLVIRRPPPPPPQTPPPVYLRERPPPIPPAEPPMIINKIVPPLPKPPRQVIIEQHPPLPPKPQNIIIERWLPAPQRPRRVLYERLPAQMVAQPTNTQPIVVQYDQPRVHIQREVITEPGIHVPHQPFSGQMNVNQILSQNMGNQQIFSSLPSSTSSLVAYNPYSSLQPAYSSLAHPQSNIVITQNPQPNMISSSSAYGMPLSCVCVPNMVTGLDAYGSGISTMPTVGQTFGQSSSTVYNVPGNIPVDQVLRQLGVDIHSMQSSTDPHSAVAHVWNAASHANVPNPTDRNAAVSHVWNAASHANPPYPQDPNSAVSHVWNAASHANPPYPQDPNSAVSHVWNAASHANPPYPQDPNSAVSHVWNSAAHATDLQRPASPAVGQVWNHLQQYLHPSSTGSMGYNPGPYPSSFNASSNY